MKKTSYGLLIEAEKIEDIKAKLYDFIDIAKITYFKKAANISFYIVLESTSKLLFIKDVIYTIKEVKEILEEARKLN